MRRIAMSANVSMTIQLQTQGKLNGSSHTGSIEVFSFSQGASNPVKIGSAAGGGGGGKATLPGPSFNNGSGIPSSSAQQKPIRIVKAVDSASPLLYHALVTSEIIKSVTFQFSQPSTGGKETVAQRGTLTNAVISKIEYAPPIKGKRCEAVTLIYQALALNGATGVHIPLSLLG
jgi:type VI secretion system Hcp family effector